MSDNEEPIRLNKPEKPEQLAPPILDLGSASRGADNALLGALRDMDQTAKHMLQIQDEVVVDRDAVVKSLAQAFVQNRMANLTKIESVKSLMIDRLVKKIDEMPLELMLNMLREFHDMTSTDLAMISGGGGGGNSPNAPQNIFNLNMHTDNRVQTSNTQNNIGSDGKDKTSSMLKVSEGLNILMDIARQAQDETKLIEGQASEVSPDE